MPDIFDELIGSVVKSLGIEKAEKYVFKVLTGTPHNVQAIHVDSLKKFFELTSTNEWFALEIINPTIKVNNSHFRAGSITVTFRYEDKKWNLESVFSDFEEQEEGADYQVRWGLVVRLFIRFLELLHLIYWIMEILLNAS